MTSGIHGCSLQLFQEDLQCGGELGHARVQEEAQAQPRRARELCQARDEEEQIGHKHAGPD